MLYPVIFLTFLFVHVYRLKAHLEHKGGPKKKKKKKRRVRRNEDGMIL